MLIGKQGIFSESPKPATQEAAPVAARQMSSEQLLGNRGELKIEHNGELYSLRRTRQGKLILTK